MFYCNLCGRPVLTLVESHELNRSRKRTGRRLMVCQSCHLNYHKFRDDWKAWGKKSVLIRKRRGTYNMSLVGKGFKFVSWRKNKKWP